MPRTSKNSAPEKANQAVTVDLPTGPPSLPPAAAAALLELLIDVLDTRVDGVPKDQSAA